MYATLSKEAQKVYEALLDNRGVHGSPMTVGQIGLYEQMAPGRVALGLAELYDRDMARPTRGNREWFVQIP